MQDENLEIMEMAIKSSKDSMHFSRDNLANNLICSISDSALSEFPIMYTADDMHVYVRQLS